MTAGKSTINTKAPTPGISHAHVEAMKQEHRQYLLDNGIVDHDMSPPSKRQKKTAPKKPTTASNPLATTSDKVDDADHALIETTVAPKKTTSKKRKAASPSSSESPAVEKSDKAKYDSDKAKHDSPTEVTPPPSMKKQKRAPAKSKASPDESVKKAKARPKSKSKSDQPTRDSKRRETPQPEVPPPPAPVSKTVLAKVKRIKDLASSLTPDTSILSRHPTNESLIHTPELHLTSAIKLMRTDYDLSTSWDDPSSDAQTIIVDRFLAPVPQTPDSLWNWVTVDLMNPFPLGETIHSNLIGHGVEAINLLEAELEMFERWLAAKEEVARKTNGKPWTIAFPMDESKAFFDEVWRKVQGDAEVAFEASTAEHYDALLLASKFEPEKELPSIGVCPAAPIVPV